MRINHNISALNTYRRLTANNTATSGSLQKLSSGLRINSAADDAAGLAISEKMRSQIRGLDQASSNANDGISLIQTAEGALNETHSILQRMRELAVQSANDTNTNSDRAEIQKEIEQLTAEITRISTDTQFNSMNLVDGSMQTDVVVRESGIDDAHVLAGASIEGGVYDVSISNFVPGDKGHPRSSVEIIGTYGGAADSGSRLLKYKTIADDNVGADGWYYGPTLIGDEAGVLASTGLIVTGTPYSGTSILATAEVTADPGTAASVTALGATDGDSSFDVRDNGILNKLKLYFPDTVPAGSALVNSSTITFEFNAGEWTATGIPGEAISKTGVSRTGLTTPEFNALGFTTSGTLIDGTKVSVTLNGAEYSREHADATVVVIQSQATNGEADKYDIAITKHNTTEEVKSDWVKFDFAEGYTGSNFSLSVDTSNALVFHIGANSGQNTTLSMNSMDAKSLGIDNLDLTTQHGADAAIITIDSAITTVSAQRAALGAMQNRLEHTINNLSTTSENLSASESQIRDVDMAKEMMEYTKNNILSQAAQSMLAQANQQPQQVLQLLQG